MAVYTEVQKCQSKYVLVYRVTWNLLSVAGLWNYGSSTGLRLLVAVQAPGHTGEALTDSWNGRTLRAQQQLTLGTVLQEKVFKEQQEIFGDSQRLPTYRAIQQMKYLDMVIKETLRLYPTVPLFGRKLRKDFDVGESNVLLFDHPILCVCACARAFVRACVQHLWEVHYDYFHSVDLCVTLHHIWKRREVPTSYNNYELLS